MQLLCVGDVAIIHNMAPWLPLDGVVFGDDIRIIINCELPFSRSINPNSRKSGPRILSHPDSFNVIAKWAPGFATLATNHILDGGVDGLVETLCALDGIGFQTIGAGLSKEEIVRPIFWDTKEGRLAIVNWVFPETNPEWKTIPGPNYWPGIKEAKTIIQSLKREANWVMIQAHWSDELFPYPRPEDRALAWELAEAGADILIGHHPHVVRGMEVIGNCHVFYSLGNFYFSSFIDADTGITERQSLRNLESLGVLISFTQGEQPDIRLISFWQKNTKVVRDFFNRAVRRLNSVSRPLYEMRNSSYEKWYLFRRFYFDRIEYRWHFRLWQLGVTGIVKTVIRNIAKFFHRI